MALDMDHLRSWIGRSETLADAATVVPPRAPAAALDPDDASQAGDALPPEGHLAMDAGATPA